MKRSDPVQQHGVAVAYSSTVGWGGTECSDPAQQLGCAGTGCSCPIRQQPCGMGSSLTAAEDSLLGRVSVTAVGWLPAVTPLAAEAQPAAPLRAGSSLLALLPTRVTAHGGIMQSTTLLPAGV